MQNKQEIPHNLSDDLKFLIACCHVEQSGINTDFILNSISEKDEEQLQNLISLSIRHGILPLVYKTIKEISNQDENTIPPEFLAKLKSYYMGISQRNMLMSAELIRITKLLRESGIEALAFKGPALSQMAYGDITLRQYVDLDILVDEADVYKASKLLESIGHISIRPLSLLSDKNFLYISKDTSFMSQRSQVHTELHWKLFDKSLCIRQKPFDLFKSYQEITINTEPINTFSNEDYILFLCLHGSKHYWERIGWIVDIDKFIRSFPRLRWDIILQNAKDNGTLRMLILGLSLSHKLFKTPMEQVVSTEIHKDKYLIRIETKILENYSLPQQEDTHIEKFSTFFEQASLRENTSTKALSFFYLLFYPKSEDLAWVKLPPSLFFLYWVIHPIRILYHKVFPKNP